MDGWYDFPIVCLRKKRKYFPFFYPSVIIGMILIGIVAAGCKPKSPSPIITPSNFVPPDIHQTIIPDPIPTTAIRQFPLDSLENPQQDTLSSRVIEFLIDESQVLKNCGKKNSDLRYLIPRYIMSLGARSPNRDKLSFKVVGFNGSPSDNYISLLNEEINAAELLNDIGWYSKLTDRAASPPEVYGQYFQKALGKANEDLKNTNAEQKTLVLLTDGELSLSKDHTSINPEDDVVAAFNNMDNKISAYVVLLCPSQFPQHYPIWTTQIGQTVRVAQRIFNAENDLSSWLIPLIEGGKIDVDKYDKIQKYYT